MKNFLLSALLLVFSASALSAQSYSASKTKPTDLALTYGAFTGAGEKRMVTYTLKNLTTKTLKNLVVEIKVNFEQNVKGKTVAGNNTENISIKELKAGATFEKPVHYDDKIFKIVSATIGVIMDEKK